jgi:uncharacterized protein YbjT (DUF2867 family)
VPLDLRDEAAVVDAAAGADALFWLVPPPPITVLGWGQWYRAIGAAGAAAVRAHGLAHVVLVSSLGAGMGPDLSVVTYTGELEQQLNATGANVLALRPGYFMENLLAQAPAIRAQGVLRYYFAADQPVPFVSVSDITAVAAHYLLPPRWAGQWTRNLMGPANLTLPQCVAQLAQVWGQPVDYQYLATAEAEQSLTLAGLPAHTQRELTTLAQALHGPFGAYATPRTPEAFTPTTFQAFAAASLVLLLNGTGGEAPLAPAFKGAH